MGSSYLSVVRKHSRPYIESLADDIKARRNPDFFWPTGTQVYVGRQGSGKTISAVRHILDMRKRYPKAVVVSNIAFSNSFPLPFETASDLRMICEEFLSGKLDTTKYYIHVNTMDELALALTNVNNDFFGVIYAIDEIHTYFNALESKNIPMYVFTEISQQRKQRKVIIGTSQLFMRMAKPFREQCDNLIMCRTILGVLTIQRAYDGMTLEQDFDGKLTGTVRRVGWFWHTRKLRAAFDTYQKVVSGAEQYESVRPIQIKDGKKLLKIG